MASSSDAEPSKAGTSPSPPGRTRDGHARSRRPRAARRMLMATFVNRDHADRALNVVRQREGYSESDVSILRSDVTREKYFGDDRHEHVEVQVASKVPEGAATGALIGAVLGTLAGTFGAVSIAREIAIPALGIALTGTLASILAGIGTGGTLGGLVGALVGAVFPEERAVRHEGHFERGGLVLGVVPKNDEDADYFYQQWDEASGERVYFRNEGAWDLFKSQLVEQYAGAITDSEIDPFKGQREKLIGHLRDATGQSYGEAEKNVRQAIDREHYTFDNESGRPADKRWERFKHHLLKTYEGDVREEDLDERQGQRERLEGHLQERTSQPQREVQTHIDDAKKASGYSFD